MADARLWFLCRAGQRRCALPLEAIVETMRPLRLDPLSGTPGYVMGASVVRGEAVPIVDVSRLLGGEDEDPQRLVVVRAGARRVALAVGEVIGVRRLADDVFSGLPSFMNKEGSGGVADLGALDGDLVSVLDAAYIVPADIFDRLEAQTALS